jgi:type I restriction enzyme S subunit
MREVPFAEFLKPNKRPYLLAADEDANLIGMRLYGGGPFHRELKPATKIRKKSHFSIRAGDIIYNKLFAWKGTFGVVPPDFDGMLVSDKFPTYLLDETKTDRDYLRWYFRYPPLWEQARQMSIGSAALSKLTLNPPKFLKLTIPLPSRPEQRRIVAKVEKLAAKLDEAIVFRKSSLEGATHVFQSALRILSGLLSVDGQIREILLGKPRNGWSPYCDNVEGGTAVLSLGAVTGFRYSGAEHKRTSLLASEDAHYWLQPGDLLITRSNTPELVGHAAIYDGTPTPCIYPDLMMRLIVDSAKAITQFVWYWLQTPVVREFIERNAKGTSPTMKKIAQGTVMAIPFPTNVSTDEQLRIVAYLDDLQTKVDSLKTLQAQSAAELDALLPSILDKAFKGEL